MSTVMYRKEIHVAEEAADMGKLFAESPHDIQCEFLKAAVEASKDFCWAMQCRYIVDDLNQQQRISLAVWLETLLEHTKEPVDAFADCPRIEPVALPVIGSCGPDGRVTWNTPDGKSPTPRPGA